MKDAERIFIGSTGAGLLHIASYPATTGYFEFILNPDIAVFLGYFARLIAAMAIGGFWAYLHKEEHNRMKVFQLGVVAPAMIAVILYANKPEIDNAVTQNCDTTPATELNLESTTGVSGNSLSLFRKAYAQHDTTDTPDDLDEERGGFFDRFIRGLWGK